MNPHPFDRASRPRSGIVLPFVTLSVVLILLIMGCDKQNQSTATSSASSADVLAQQEAIKAGIRLQVQQTGFKVTVPIHQKLEFYYGDSVGNRIAMPGAGHRAVTLGGAKTTDNIVSGCDGDPNGYANLNSYSLITDCSSGYKISFNTTVSTDDNIVAANPYNLAQTSKGSLRIYNSSNTLVYSDLTIAMDPATNPPIDLGPDSTNPGYELFNVTFTSAFISEATFDPSPAKAYTMKFGAFYESDCSDLEHSNGGLWAQMVGSTQLPDLSPLNRVDPIWPNPGFGSYQISVYGMEAGVTCTMSLTPPDLQEIEDSTAGDTAWIGQVATSTMNYIAPPTNIPPFVTLVNGTDSNHYGYVDPYGALELGISVPSGATVYLRYRDIVFNTEPGTNQSFPIPTPGTNCSAGPWSDPIIVSY